MFKKLLIVYSFIGLFLMAPLAHAQDAQGTDAQKQEFINKWHKRSEQRAQEIYSQLNLSDEQKAALEANKLKSSETRKALFEQMHAYKDALNQELMKPDLDMAKVNGIQAQTKALQAQMADHRLNAILEVRKILTPKQFAQFLLLMKKHHWDKSDTK